MGTTRATTCGDHHHYAPRRRKAVAIMDLLTIIRNKIRTLNEERTAALADLAAATQVAVTEGRSELTEAEMTARAEARARIEAIDVQLDGTDAEPGLLAREAEEAKDAEKRQAADELAKRLGSTPAPAGVPVVHVGAEPTTYRKGGTESYFRDLARANAPGGGNDEARGRLQRHAQEMQVELRTNMSTSDGAGGEFVPPLWLIDQYLPLARAGRVTADLCNKQPLPSGTDSIKLPSVATGASTAEQTQNAAASNTDMTTSSVSADVTTLAGQQVFAMQLIDQSPINFDEVVFGDLLADLAKRLDIYVLNKASIGILNVSSINAVTYTDASPTVAELYPKVADGVQQIHTNRFLPPQAHVMHPRRWGWFLAALDSNNRPLVVPSENGPQNAFAGMSDVRAEGSVGTLQGIPVYVDSNVPINLGGSTNEDRIITARFDDLYLYESMVKSRVLYETDANTLQVRLQVWEYAAFLGSRYPKSIAVVSGTGLATPSF